MTKNRFIIAAAGSGKTTYLINEAIKVGSEKVLITTYTEANEAEIRKKIIKTHKFIPTNLTIQTWFSFLIQHGVKPYQGTLNELMFDNQVAGLNLVTTRSGAKLTSDGKKLIYEGHPLYWSEDNFKNHYFTKNWKIHSDKLSKLVCKANENSKGEVINRISRIYENIFIDEVQDLAGYDLELIKLLFRSQSKILLVGDPRQVTYLTHNEAKHNKYSDGRIKQFLLDNCKSLIKNGIDETSLSVSHRNNKEICFYSSKLYPELSTITPCICFECRSHNSVHNGVFFVLKQDIDSYLLEYKETMQLRWNTTVSTHHDCLAENFGESKGKTFERVLIYPTDDMKKWTANNNHDLKNGTRAKFYVAITRAKYSVAIVVNATDKTDIEGITMYKPKKTFL